MSMSKKKFIIILAIAILAVGGYFLWKYLSTDKTSQTAKTVQNQKDDLYGVMSAYNVNDGLNSVNGAADELNKSYLQFKNNQSLYQQFLDSLKKLYPTRNDLLAQTSFSSDRELNGLFAWNVIEPEKGQFNWTLTDLAIQSAQSAGIKISAVIEPFASWDQTNTQINPNCKALGMAWYDYKAGPPQDLTEYQNFLTKVVERYKNSVAGWEIGNEPDSECDGFQNNPDAYYNLVKTSYETIKKTDPQAIVLNGGAVEVVDKVEADSIKSFWTKFFELGGGNYIDFFNLHYNSERSVGAKENPTDFLENLAFFNSLMEKNNSKKPIWLTEFGTYAGSFSNQETPAAQPQSKPSSPKKSSGSSSPDESASPSEGASSSSSPSESTPASSSPTSTTPTSSSTPSPVDSSPGTMVKGVMIKNFDIALPVQTEEFQSAWYFKYSILAFANNTKRIFIDLVGNDQNPIGGSMIFNLQNKPKQFLTTLITINSKIVGFSQAEKIADGQYKFSVSGKSVYALWSGTLPKEISGNIKVTDLKGQEKTVASQEIKLQDDQPIIVELP